MSMGIIKNGEYNKVAGLGGDASESVTLQSQNSTTIAYNKSKAVEGIVAICASIQLPSGSSLVKENAVASVPNKYGTAGIDYILPCLYRNMGSGAEEPGFAIIGTTGMLYSYYTKSEYNEIRINASYASKL